MIKASFVQLTDADLESVKYLYGSFSFMFKVSSRSFGDKLDDDNSAFINETHKIS